MNAAKKKFARYPSCVGELDCQGLCDMARKNGMKIISACKPGMDLFSQIGLYGTAAQMEKTEREWTAAGNELKPAKFKSVFRVNLNIPEEDWEDTVTEWFRAHAVEVGSNGWQCKLAFNGGAVLAPQGYRKLRASEPTTINDIAWHADLGLWTAIRQKDIDHCGAADYAKFAYCVLRKKK
jgi:hypothetical protein